jgi:heterodisulfide reductase subunit C
VIASALALAAAIAVAGGLFARRVWLLTRLVRMGRPPGIQRGDDVPERLRAEAVVVLGQRKLLQRLIPGLMHAFIFWAFIVLFPSIFIAMIAIVDEDAAPHWAWYEALADVFSVLALIGVATAFYIRKVVRPRRFEGSHLGEADLILALIAAIVTTLLLWHATDSQVLAWAHVLPILGFLAYLPHSKHLHIATAAINVYFGRTRARGRLEPLRFDEDTPEEEMRFGIGTVEDLTWKQMMDAFSCTECGRCQDACPAYATGKVLSPKLVIMGVRDHLFEEGPKALAGDYEGPLVAATGQLEEMAWDCVTCGACVEACPVNIEQIDHILDLRRHLVMVESRFPSEAEPMLRDVERQGNPIPRLSSCTGSAARRRSTTGRARARGRRRSCSPPPAWTSRSSARARRAPATRPAGWATSSSSSPMPSRTSRRSARRA